MVLLQLAFLLSTLAAVLWTRSRWPAWSARPRLATWVRLGLAAWMMLANVALSHAVAVLGGMSFEWGAIGKILAFAALLAWPLALVPLRWARYVAGAQVIGLAVLGFADLLYFRHFGSLLPVVALWSTGQTWAVRESLGVLVRARDLWLTATLLAAGVVAVGVPSSASRVGRGWLDDLASGGRRRQARRARRDALVMAGLLLLPGFGIARHNADSWRTRRVLSHDRLVGHLGLYGAHVMDALRVWRELRQREEATPEQIAHVRDYLVRNAREHPVLLPGGGSMSLYGVASGASVLVVQVESLQRFVIGLRAGGREITTFLNSLTRSAAFYSNITDQTGESNTSDTEYLVNNSQHPMQHGAVVFRRPTNHFVAVPHRLAAAGYTTLAAHPWDRGFWNRAVLYPRYGFQRTLFRKELGGIVDQVGWGSSDTAFYREMTPVLRRLPRPFYAHLVTLMSHHPYTFYPPERRKLDLGGIDDTMLGAYLQLMHEVDASLRDFLTGLRAAGALENTVVVVYGDHDARLQTPANRIDAAAAVLDMPAEKIERLGRRDPRVDFVPLFIDLPGDEIQGTVAAAGGQIDVGPTILYLLGLEQPSSFMGRPLLPGGGGFAARIDGSALDDHRFFVSRGVDVPPDGLCSRLADGVRLPSSACAELVERGAEQVRASWEITELDLAKRVTELVGRQSVPSEGAVR